MRAIILRFLALSPVARRLILWPIFGIGYLIFRLTGNTPWLSYLCFRKLHSQTRGGLNDRIARAISARSCPHAFSGAQGLLGTGADVELQVAKARETLVRDGYYRLPESLTAAQCDSLQRFARLHPAQPVPLPTDCARRLVFDPATPCAPTYVFDESELLAEPVIQQLLGDQSLLLLAQRYMDAPPINDSVTMWWSAPFGAASSEAAQLFHFDMDGVRWLKFFFYLTDVGPENGPHVYVRGTHRCKPALFFEDRRFSDEEIASHFAAQDVVTLTAPAGTVFVGDTRCLHKGQPVREGCRLLLQIEFSLSLFGKRYARPALPPNIDPVLEEARGRHPSVYQRFLSR
jgi:hypothetical protein